MKYALTLGLVCAVACLLFLGGCGALVSGNVYSEGYRDGYIVGVTHKRQGLGGLSFVGEIKVSGYGFGGLAVDPSKPGQTSCGAWSANFYDKKIEDEASKIRGDQLCRFYYTERDIVFTGGTNYDVTKIVILPSGELDGIGPPEK